MIVEVVRGLCVVMTKAIELFGSGSIYACKFVAVVVKIRFVTPTAS